MTRDFDRLAAEALAWLPEHGVGYYPVTNPQREYFDIYEEYSRSAMAPELNRARVDLVRRHHVGRVLDVGIGCGQFIEAHGDALGFDVDPSSIGWLTSRGLYHDPSVQGSVEAATFWDSMEHIESPSDILSRVTRWAFLSIPVFMGSLDVLSSKHYKKTEHFWYFTEAGLLWFMREQGFQCRESSNMESTLGRESIGSYAFERAR